MNQQELEAIWLRIEEMMDLSDDVELDFWRSLELEWDESTDDFREELLH